MRILFPAYQDMDGVGLPVATHVRRTVLSITTSVLGGAITIVGDAGGGRGGSE